MLSIRLYQLRNHRNSMVRWTIANACGNLKKNKITNKILQDISTEIKKDVNYSVKKEANRK